MENEKSPNFFQRLLLGITRIIPQDLGVLGLIPIVYHRSVLQDVNLYGPPLPPNPDNVESPDYRRADAKGNDKEHWHAGGVGTPFGRNMPPKEGEWMEGPDVQVVAQKLLQRRGFKPAGMQLNVLAVAWIQAMAHDWFGHYDSEEDVELSNEGAQCPLKMFRFKKTLRRADGYFDSFRTHWWDASFVYGQNDKAVNRARTFKDGKMHASGTKGRLAMDDDGNYLVGDAKNSWLGVSMLQELFVREHNAVCDAVMSAHPELRGEDEKLFRVARLVVAAVVAKIHTVDWTVELLKNRTLDVGMNANWFGLTKALGCTKKGPPGPFALVANEKQDTHGVPFCLTEEFVSVYRLHPMLPDGLPLQSGYKPLEDLVGLAGDSVLDEGENMPREVWQALLKYPCGNLELFNYPTALRDLAPTDDQGHDLDDHVDLAALDLYRDRERGIRRYNDFRRALQLDAFKNFDDLTDDKDAVAILKEVYGEDGIEKLDLLVGMLAEKKIKGFAISETAFVIFLLMASRRLESDRFLNESFTDEVYTKCGKAWVEDCAGIRDVLQRHWPEIEREIPKGSGFTPWEKWPQA